jgi:hypothetical protein
MDILSLSSSAKRRARTRSFVQLGGLIEKSGLLEVFGIVLGEDLQQSPDMKLPVASLFKGFLTLKEMIESEDINLHVWGLQGLEGFKAKSLSEKRPLDKNRVDSKIIW